MWRHSIKLSFRSITRHRINTQQFIRFFSEGSASYSEDEEISTREEIFACLKTEGCSNGDINSIFAKFPEITKLDVESDIYGIITFLKSQDFEVGPMLTRNPLILDRDPKYMLQIMEFLTGSGLEGETLKEFVRENPEFLTVDYKNLYWVKAFFEDELGFDDISPILTEVPELTLKTEEQVRTNADMLDQVGLNVAETVEQCPWLLATDSGQLKETIQFMFDLVGIQQKRVFTLCPELLDYAQPNLQEKVLFLHSEGHNVRNLLLNEPTVFQADFDEFETKTIDEILDELDAGEEEENMEGQLEA